MFRGALQDGLLADFQKSMLRNFIVFILFLFFFCIGKEEFKKPMQKEIAYVMCSMKKFVYCSSMGMIISSGLCRDLSDVTERIARGETNVREH